MHYLLADDGCEPFLLEELKRAHPAATSEEESPNWIITDAPLEAPLVFARQTLPNAQRTEAASINAWADKLIAGALESLPEGQPWRLQIVPCYGDDSKAGLNRRDLILAALRERLQKRRRMLLRTLEPMDTETPFREDTSLVQLYLMAPDQGILSVAPAPVPYELRRNLWPFPKGELPVAVDKTAPSRAFAKLVEAEQRLGLHIANSETMVDLGASPGSWSYVGLNRGAHVTAVDRSPVRDDLMRNRRLTFVQGDAFKFLPAKPVDWLVCDVIAAPERNMGLLIDWVRNGHCRRFIVTIKFKGHAEYAILDELKKVMPGLCAEFYLTRLCANKNEACAFGVVKG
ncbi:MAG: hypothetical protein JWO94_3234 [Verrucomicrobiaceae bacterium]|nr:hypothetical protein [Verrucomicrobiaceae bacterium]